MNPRSPLLALSASVVLVGCGSSEEKDATGHDAVNVAPAATACSTRVTYGSAWLPPANHPGSFDVIAGDVTWDGTCTDDGADSYASFSNGWQPHFQGNGACVVALDYEGSCTSVPASCTTRISYGSAWLPPANHPSSYDDVSGRIFSDGSCHPSGGSSFANLSNGWTPTFSGTAGCRLSFEYTQCGGLYANPVVPTDCPDPGVLHDGDHYVLTCTSNDAADAYPIYTSSDLATWTLVGHVFPSGQWPVWAKQNFWAPEIHKVGSSYVVYFTARGADGMLAIGAASSLPPRSGLSPTWGAPLIHDSGMGLIDASEINTPDRVLSRSMEGRWKRGREADPDPRPTAHRQRALLSYRLAVDVLDHERSSLGRPGHRGSVHGRGVRKLLPLLQWKLVRQFDVRGRCRAGESAPTGPFTKASAPILVTGGPWVGPGHCAVVDTPAGDTAIVYAAWKQGMRQRRRDAGGSISFRTRFPPGRTGGPP